MKICERGEIAPHKWQKIKEVNRPLLIKRGEAELSIRRLSIKTFPRCGIYLPIKEIEVNAKERKQTPPENI